jgi:hypothetical protein
MSIEGLRWLMVVICAAVLMLISAPLPVPSEA